MTDRGVDRGNVPAVPRARACGGRRAALVGVSLLTGALAAACTSVAIPLEPANGAIPAASGDRAEDTGAADRSAQPDGARRDGAPRRDTVFVVDTVRAVTDEPVFAEEMLLEPEIDPVLGRRIGSIIDAPLFRQMHWGILARDLHTGRILYERNAQRKFTPASNMKVLTAAAALSLLGPEFRFRTALWAFSDLDEQGVLQGPLVLDGRGDPTLSERYHESGRAALGELARQVRASGVRRVAGPLVIDVSRWDSVSVPGTWMVEDLGWSWGASGGGFAIDEGEIEVVVLGGNAPGDPASVVWPSDLDPDWFASEVVTTAVDTLDLRPNYRPSRGQIVLGGRIKPAVRRREALAARDPVRLAGELLLQALRDEGVRVDGGVEYRFERGELLGRGCSTGSIDRCTARTVATLESPPLLEVAAGFLGPSQNWVTEQVVRALGLELGERGSWDEGLRIVEETLTRDFAVLSNDLDLRDGSGLSAYGLVTPRAMVDVLFQLRIRPMGDAFEDALPIGGQSGTTLSGRLRELGPRVHAKTGTLTHVNALSGYLVRDNGREMVFSILTGNAGLKSSEVRRAVDAVVRELARW